MFDAKIACNTLNFVLYYVLSRMDKEIRKLNHTSKEYEMIAFTEYKNSKAATPATARIDLPHTWLVPVECIESPVDMSEFAPEIVEAMARAIMRTMTLSAPLRLRSLGYRDGMPRYALMPGQEFEMAAIRRAEELDPMRMELCTAWVDMDFGDQALLIAQGKATQGAVVATLVENKTLTRRQAIELEVVKCRSDPKAYTKKRKAELERVAQAIGI